MAGKIRIECVIDVLAARALRPCAWLMLLLCAALTSPGAAQDAPPRLRVRGMVGAGMMVSNDQVNRLGFNAAGLVADVQVGYAILPFLDVHAVLSAGAFATGQSTGGLLAPQVGVSGFLAGGWAEPYVFFEAGPGFTGALTRPLLRVGTGLDFKVTRALTLGPVLGYANLFQVDAPHASTDARYVWLGASLAFRPGTPDAPTESQHFVVLHEVRHEQTVVTVRTPAETLPVQPSPELNALLDNAIPSTKVELLAPVLFRLDSDELEPIAVAMLHEVARELAERHDLKLLEIQGYADRRGDPERNVTLSARRAERVRDWLVQHGVAGERLRVAPEGASAFVEEGTAESNHQQNRRVVFRVIESGQP